MANHRFRRDRSEVSSVIKYLVFFFNIIFWILGGLMLAIGLWAWVEKDMFTNINKLSQIPLDPALFLILVGGLIFVIGFTGCIGALRENTFLLMIYCVSVGIIFFCEMAVGIIVFMYKDWVRETVKEQLKSMIVQYRDDPDLQNLIDWVQEDWLKCCGVEGYDDWNWNVYFNCSSPSREACGVPFSCCKPNNNEAIKNWQCGYDTRKVDSKDISDQIYTTGCIDSGEVWVNHNLLPVAGVFIGLALVQILGICFAQNLRSDIFAQKARWEEL
ncbi:hypothetical protein HELRODRAFT_83813 [Helobdella robusta]|uniref:Tetraspanin n=1 Tax=Helobdella robusta TaxID=6412 RepID=T1G5A7_HELRO|nr:hypothetical protein HELRODRAFT_83813 [Helobdella robusta]ESN99860.1 hypothetical protein HELRODRAFT_83813 [Helobdella robusta]